MKTDLKSILEALTLTSLVVFAPACGEDDDDADGADETTTEPGTTAGCPGTTAGCPGTTAGCPGTTAGCPGTTAGCPGTTAGCPGTTAGCPGTTAGCPANAVPTDAAAMTAWLADDGYAGWAAESAPHASTGPHGRVLTHFNDSLVASFDAADATHPVGSAAVKELLADDDTVTGFAVMVKTTDGSDAASWYWYLQMDGSVAAEGDGLAGCDDCHSDGGIDRVLTPYPLQ